MYKKFSHILLISPFIHFFPIKVASDGYRREYVSFAHFLLYFYLNYLPLQIWTLKMCIHDISKTITARSFKLGQLIEDDEEIDW